MKKLKNLCLTVLIACSLGGTNVTQGSQRFINLARYAIAAAARCSQAFQTIKQSKPAQWIQREKPKLIIIGSAMGCYSFAHYLWTPESQSKKFTTLIESLIRSYTLENIKPINLFSPESEALIFIKQLIENKNIKGSEIYAILEPLIYTFSPENKTLLAQLLLARSFDELKPQEILALLFGWGSEELQTMWVEKLTANDRLFSSYHSTFSSRCNHAQGPLFSSDFIAKNLWNIKCCSLATTLFAHLKTKDLKTTKILNDITSFARQEYTKGNVVLFHGQHDQWAFFEKIFKALLKLKYKKTIPENHLWIRPVEKPLLSHKEVQDIRKNGITDSTYEKYRNKVLFTNLHLLANEPGSNSLFYFLSNSDQTAGKGDYDAYVMSQFRELAIEKEFETKEESLFHKFYAIFKQESDTFQRDDLTMLFELLNNPYKKEITHGQQCANLQEECQTLFEQLYNLYKKAIIARGNVGRIIAISLPKNIASEVCYPTSSAGPLTPIKINDKETTDITIIAENYEQVPFDNEYCLILSELITNPEKAAAAGIVMKTFSSEPTEESKKYEAEFEAEFEKIMNRIGEIRKERMEKKKVIISPFAKATADSGPQRGSSEGKS